MAKFIFVRHGESEANRDKILGTPEALLTEDGIEQARKTGNELVGKGIKTILCSPFLRARQTAETIADIIDVAKDCITIVDDLHERRMGSLEGTPRTHESEWYYLEMSEDMESPEYVLQRVSNSLNRIKQLTQDGDSPVLVVGHAVSGFYMLQVASGKASIEEFDPPSQMPNADYIEVEI